MLLEVHLALTLGNLQIRVHPHVLDVPADRAILTSLQNGGMEVGQSKHELLVLFGLRATFVLLLTDVEECTVQISPETSGWFICQLDATLQHWDWEVVARLRGQPKTILRMHGIFVLCLLNALKFRHPRRGQMTIL